MELFSFWCLLTLVLHLSDAQEEAAVVPSAAGDQNAAMSPPEFQEIIPPAVYETPSTDGYYPSTESTPYYPQQESMMPGGMEQTRSPDDHDMSGDPHPDQEEESWDNHPSTVTGPDGMPYTTPMPLYTRGITRKTRWGSNRNTVKRFNNLNPFNRKRQNGNSKSDKQQGEADGILTKLNYADKWNRVGVITGGD